MTEKEFKEIFMPMHKKLYACALSILRNECDAADCLQDSFSRLWENRSKLKDISNVAAYAFTTVRNMALNMTSRRSHLTTSLNELTADPPDDSPSPSGRLETEDTHRTINTLFSNLSSGQREVLQLSTIGGFSNSEISAITGMTDENVRTSLSRARKKLRLLFSKNNFLK